jgi:hypothetical protein
VKRKLVVFRYYGLLRLGFSFCDLVWPFEKGIMPIDDGNERQSGKRNSQKSQTKKAVEWNVVRQLTGPSRTSPKTFDLNTFFLRLKTKSFLSGFRLSFLWNNNSSVNACVLLHMSPRGMSLIWGWTKKEREKICRALKQLVVNVKNIESVCPFRLEARGRKVSRPWIFDRQCFIDIDMCASYCLLPACHQLLQQSEKWSSEQQCF